MFHPPLALTVNNAATVLDAGLRAIASGQTEFDFSAVTAVDSSAVALLLAWQRAAAPQSTPLSFINVPANLRSLAALYGVTELIALHDPVSISPDLPPH